MTSPAATLWGNCGNQQAALECCGERGGWQAGGSAQWREKGWRQVGAWARHSGHHGPCRNPRRHGLDGEWWCPRRAAPAVEAVATVRGCSLQRRGAPALEKVTASGRRQSGIYRGGRCVWCVGEECRDGRARRIKESTSRIVF
jgi:hypothetical protein